LVPAARSPAAGHRDRRRRPPLEPLLRNPDLRCVIFFFASAGASAAYLTASAVFPLETRALCIAFFYAIGTAVEGISGPLLFGKLIDNASERKDITRLAIGYFIGAALMVIGGVVEGFLGVKAEGQSLASLAQPLTAEDAKSGGTDGGRREPAPSSA